MKLKLFAAALAFAATGSAHALISDGASGNGELFFTLWDPAGEQSYTLDLNITMDTFLAGIAQPGARYEFTADANMNTFLGQVTQANKANLLFAIGAMDNTGATATNYYRYITTASDIKVGSSTQDQLTNNQLKNLGTSGDSYLGDVNSLLGAGNSVIVTNPAAVAYAGSAQWGSNWGKRANFTSTGVADDDDIIETTDLGMYFLRQSSGATSANNTRSIYASILQGGNQVYANFNYTNGKLIIAAVPEPETYALMLAGLGLVGFMARRRNRA